MRLRHITLSLALLATMFFSCHKEQSPKATYLTDYYRSFWYGYGSYWVFFDSVSGRTDSIACIPDHIIPFAKQNPTENTEQYSYSLLGTSYKRFDTTTYYWAYKVDAPSATAFYGGQNAGSYGMEVLTNDPPMLYERNENLGRHYYYKSELLPTFTVNGIKYDSVYRITGEYGTYYSNTVCISRTAGFILMDINDNTGHKKLALLRSKIVQ